MIEDDPDTFSTKMNGTRDVRLNGYLMNVLNFTYVLNNLHLIFYNSVGKDNGLSVLISFTSLDLVTTINIL